MGGSNGSSEKGFNSRYIFKIEVTGFPDSLIQGSSRKEGGRNIPWLLRAAEEGSELCDPAVRPDETQAGSPASSTLYHSGGVCHASCNYGFSKAVF